MTRKHFAVLVMVVLVGSACSGDDEVPMREAKAGTKSGGKITIAIDEPRNIDPPAGDPQDPSGAAVIETMCDRLIELDPVTGEPKPAIAESWIVSDGGERVTIKLRKGVKFHNGRELIAEDVVYSLSRIADRDFAGPSASIMQPVGGYEQVHGNEEVDDETLRRQLRGLSVIENYSFQVSLSERRSDFVRALAHVAASPVPKQEVEDDPDGFARKPICTGPYKLKAAWKPGATTIALERFDEYYGRNAAFTQGGKGYADEIEFRIDKDGAAAVKAFQEGAAQVAAVPETSDLARQANGPVVAGRTPLLEYIGLPTKQAPFDKRGTRIAFSQALDRNAIVEQVYGGPREPARAMLPPSLGDLHRENGCGDHAPPTADVTAARRSLARAGVDLAGETLNFYFNDEFGHRKLVEAVTKQWTAAFGVKFKLVGLGWEAYIDKGVGQPGFDAPFRMSWVPEYLSADRYLQPLFDSKSIGQNNFTRYSNRDFDRALDREARRAVDERDIRREYQDLATLVCGDMPLIPLDLGARPYAVDENKVGGAIENVTSAATGMIVLRELYAK